MRALSDLDPSEKYDRISAALRDDNRSSVALHIDGTDAFGCSVLLGADLVAKPPEMGWHAVTNDWSLNLRSTQLTKVAHHGSKENFDEEVWNRLTDPGSMLLVAPFWNGKKSIPKADDILRMSRYGQVHLATRRTKPKKINGHKRYPQVEVGAVQARRRAGEDTWRVRHYSPAYAVS